MDAITDTRRESRKDPAHFPLAGWSAQPLSLPISTATGLLPIVALGSSAGGIAALTALLTALPRTKQPDMAIILIQHLPAEGASSLVNRLQQSTQMQVCEILNGMALQPNRVYVGPGERHVAVRQGSLWLHDAPANRMDCLPIDFLFRSLAEDQGRYATGIILSGTGSDGSTGLCAIKAKGGMVMVQSPESAAYAGMPRRAIATGMVDAILAPEAIGSQLCDYLTNNFGRLSAISPTNSRAATAALALIRTTLHNETNHDFSSWGTDSLAVQVERRMTLQQIDTVERYSKFLRQSPDEIHTLCRELLIGTTAFFAQAETLTSLATAVAELISAKAPPIAPLRIWVTGCASGEEVYALAILIDELLRARPYHPHLQIFATDSDQQALAIARGGFYPDVSLTTMTPDRLHHYFTRIDDLRQYRVAKVIRDSILFTEHDLLGHPSFRNLDLIYCRNFASYLTAIPQQKLIYFLYNLLSPGGILCLGQTGIDAHDSCPFRAVDQRHNIYKRPELPGTFPRCSHRNYRDLSCSPPLSQTAQPDMPNHFVTGSTAPSIND